MENQDAYVIQDPQEIPLDFDHYKTLTAALADAIQRCMVWREQESGTPYTGKDLYEFAQRHDKQFVMGEDEFYMVTFEGAIGLSPGLEWLTKWVFVPMEPGEEQERLLEQMKEELRKEGNVVSQEDLSADSVEEGMEEVAASPLAEKTADTVDEQEQANRHYAEEAVWMGHYHYLLQALSVALTRCKVWRTAEGGEAVSINKLFHFAKTYDTEHPLDDQQFYMVTIEGAIGISPGVEWLTQWLFVPMEPCAERDAMMRQMKEKLEEHERQESMSQTVSTPQSQPPLPPPPPMSPMPLRFCTNCGVKLRPGLRFCTNCGKRLIP